jgi:6-phosphogluconolactonase
MHSSIPLITLLASIVTAANASRAGVQALPCWTYVAGKEGISLFRLDPSTGALQPQGLAAPEEAEFLAFTADGQFAYAIDSSPAANDRRLGEVLAFSVDRATGKLTLLNRQSSQGDGPCFVTVDPQGKNVLVANYSSATVAVLPIGPDGSLGAARSVIKQTGSSVDPSRQKQAYAHSINLDPTGRIAFVADLGTDQLFIYQFDSARGKLMPSDPPFVRLPPGSGPRHFTFDPAGECAYLINELSGTIAVYSFDSESGRLDQEQLIRTLPADFKGLNTSAEVQVDPRGDFLYASNRGDTNFLTIFSIDHASGKLSLVGYQPTLGKTPRNFRIDPSGSDLIVANQESDSIVLFSIDRVSGRLRPVGEPQPVKAPMCVKFLAMTGP